ncbi:MAG: TRAP transporter substrate-binding protein [Proteobacteria bacterium]|nr:TRAP transporter substrate-binding protein [Pseudomonadota bacterium]
MERKKLLISSLVVCLTLFLGVLFLNPALATAKEAIKLKVAVSYPARHPMTVNGFGVWAKKLEERTGGQVKVTLFPGETLSKTNENYDATVSGVCDIAMFLPAYSAGRFPLSNAMNLPMLFPNSTVASQAAWDLYQKFEEIKAEYRDTKPLFFYFTPPYEIHTVKKAINTMEDLKGLQIRSTGPIDAKILETFGASPVAISMPEAYLGLERGVLDGLVSPYGPMRGFKTADVTRFHTSNANLFSNVFGVVMNLNKWKSLPPEIQEGIMAVSGSEAARLFGNAFDRTSQPDIKYMKDKGDTFTTLSPEEKKRWTVAIRGISDNWVKEIGAKGMPSGEILSEMIKLSTKYSK